MDGGRAYPSRARCARSPAQAPADRAGSSEADDREARTGDGFGGEQSRNAGHMRAAHAGGDVDR